MCKNWLEDERLSLRRLAYFFSFRIDILLIQFLEGVIKRQLWF